MENIKKLYQAGYTMQEISEQLNMEYKTVQNILMSYKLEQLKKDKHHSLLEEILALSKTERESYIPSLSPVEIKQLKEDISSFLSENKNNYEDVVGVIWIIAEMNFLQFSDFLCLHSSSKNKNIKRIVYSSMGKMMNTCFIPYLKMGCRDEGIQVRMYAIKSLEKYYFENKKHFFEELLKKEINLRNQEILKAIIRGNNNE